MSIISLASKGIQDTYLLSDDLTHSPFRSKFSRHTNFAQTPKHIKDITQYDTSIKIPVVGDLINAVWFEGLDIATKLFKGSTIDLYIGGVKIDSHKYEYLTDIWQIYLAPTWTRSQEMNNPVSTTTKGFVPLQFFFCGGMHGGFLPLVAMQFHEVEIRVNLDHAYVSTLTAAERKARCYCNAIFLDTEERQSLVSRQMDLVITQVQSLSSDVLSTVTNNLTQVGGNNTIDLSFLNHPVKSLFFGFKTLSNDEENDRFTFLNADIVINGEPLVEKMSPMYFHTVQTYYNCPYGIIQFDESNYTPFYTRYYSFHFALNPEQYKSTGSLNFSRLDSAKLVLRGVEKGVNRPANQDLTVMAVSWNVLTIKDGVCGLRFSS
ncbi:hypothetical protein DSLPV1_053 [Dishui lake phycodnavirus 1]|uniref:hypothetical protein n=1 Tax=Dishui lake phycodnavirus 1 TaxID=2079134 RepID=UPI000CD6773A|nr:hypothetical protein C5Y57_gp053 [Dishui lake phycodnavirus 1]AUT19024.1 hypothetical protein DSLPV1_053 [Dishui lake phycodnavirus 1]